MRVKEESACGGVGEGVLRVLEGRSLKEEADGFTGGQWLLQDVGVKVADFANEAG
jgi:hypothetical protein